MLFFQIGFPNSKDVSEVGRFETEVGSNDFYNCNDLT